MQVFRLTQGPTGIEREAELTLTVSFLSCGFTGWFASFSRNIPSVRI